MRHLLAAATALVVALAMAAPAAANTAERFAFDDLIEESFSCGVTATISVHGDGIAFLDGDGAFLRATIQIRYDAIVEDPATGATARLVSRQVVSEADGTVTLRAQGTFVHAPGKGVLLLDVGRLVVDPSDDSTIAASAHVLRFDDPEASAKVDAAMCSLFD